jgi:hypothetical protein
MYDLSQLVRGLKNPNLLLRELNRLYHRRLNTRSYNTGGIDIFSEDWDNLLILDACRYDLFEANWEYDGILESRESRGSATTEFLSANFASRDLRDTVYVTANPQLYRKRNQINCDLHCIMDVWNTNAWDRELGTVRPGTLTEVAKRAMEEYPQKRVIVHYIQPHFPFIQSETQFDKGHLETPVSERDGTLWVKLIEGKLDIPSEEIWNLYEGNLVETLPHVYDLLKHSTGKTVVTSDHGNVIGERAWPLPCQEWGHPRGIYIDELVTVPWLVAESKPRKTIESGRPVASESEIEDSVVSDRLEQLGYV